MEREALKLAFEAHRKDERHHTVAETRYWCNQYKLLAHQAIEALAQPAQERDFIATKWENLYGYDKQGVAEFIRKRANTQGEQHEHH